MKDNQYTVIQAFMVKDLHLKGNELIVYAVIFGYTQDGEHWYYGTKGNLAEWCGASKGTVLNCLQSLVDKGLVERREREDHGHVFVEYRASNFCTPRTTEAIPPVQILDPPRTNFGPINKIEDIPNKTNNKDRGFTPPTVEEVREYCQERGSGVDPEAFVDYYSSQGWKKANGQRVQDWKGCVRTWEKKDGRSKDVHARGTGRNDAAEYAALGYVGRSDATL